MKSFLKSKSFLLVWAAAYALMVIAILKWGGVVALGASVTSVDAHYSNGSNVSTMAPSVLTATANAIAATQPAPIPMPAAPVVVPAPMTAPSNANRIMIGGNETNKTLAAVKWSGNRVFVLHSGTYDVPEETIQAGDSITLQPVSGGSVTLNLPSEAAGKATINVNGSFACKGFKITGGAKATFVQTHESGNADLENLTGDACCLFWGSGGGTVSILNCSAPGAVSQYAICNFNAPLASLHVDGCTLAQGPNQACVRLMEVVSSLVENSTFIGANQKQCIQDRSTGADLKAPGHIWKNVTVKCTARHGWTADIGPMTWQDYSTPANTPQPLTLSEWINCTLPDYPLVERPGGKKTVQRIVYQNCTIAGQKNVNKDFN